jgi:F0F1-type ATP synthase assembly protein I
MPRDEGVSKYFRTAALLSSIPLTLASGPFAGYFIGDYLKRRFQLEEYITYIFILLGIAVSLNTVVRIIILLKESAQKPKG